MVMLTNVCIACALSRDVFSLARFPAASSNNRQWLSGLSLERTSAMISDVLDSRVLSAMVSSNVCEMISVSVGFVNLPLCSI